MLLDELSDFLFPFCHAEVFQRLEKRKRTLPMGTVGKASLHILRTPPCRIWLPGTRVKLKNPPLLKNSSCCLSVLAPWGSSGGCAWHSPRRGGTGEKQTYRNLKQRLKMEGKWDVQVYYLPPWNPIPSLWTAVYTVFLHSTFSIS